MALGPGAVIPLCTFHISAACAARFISLRSRLAIGHVNSCRWRTNPIRRRRLLVFGDDVADRMGGGLPLSGVPGLMGWESIRCADLVVFLCCLSVRVASCRLPHRERNSARTLFGIALVFLDHVARVRGKVAQRGGTREPSGSAATTRGGARRTGSSARATADGASGELSARARAEDTHGALLVGDEANPVTKRKLCPWLWLPTLASVALRGDGCIFDFGRGGRGERYLNEIALLTRLHSVGDADEIPFRAPFGSGLPLTK